MVARRRARVSCPLLGLLLVTAATAQDHSGRIEGVVVDAASHQPVRKATVFINFMGGFKSMVTAQTQRAEPQIATTDASGKFIFDSLSAGPYQLTVTHPSYPQGRMGVRKSMEVKDGTASGVTVELVPGASITGRIVDEDGDPLNGCYVQVYPAGKSNTGVAMRGPIMRVTLEITPRSPGTRRAPPRFRTRSGRAGHSLGTRSVGWTQRDMLCFPVRLL